MKESCLDLRSYEIVNHIIIAYSLDTANALFLAMKIDLNT
jgi:hypothetical protein